MTTTVAPSVIATIAAMATFEIPGIERPPSPHRGVIVTDRDGSAEVSVTVTAIHDNTERLKDLIWTNVSAALRQMVHLDDIDIRVTVHRPPTSEHNGTPYRR